MFRNWKEESTMSKFKGSAKASTTTTLTEVLNTAQTSFSIPERGITDETVKHFGIRRMMNELTGEVDSYFFPITKKKETTGFIKVTPSRSKKNGRFTTVGDVSVTSDLLGQSNATGKNKLFIVEGCFDLLSAFQALNSNKGTYTGFPCVVSPALGIGDINKGVTNSRQHVVSNLEFVNGFKDVIVCFDNDEQEKINVGQEGVQDLALALKEFKNVLLPVNDCNDMLKEKGEKELFFALMTAKTFENEHIITGGIDLDELLEPLKEGITVSVLPNTSRILHGFREREMTIVLAPTGIGKTTVCKEIGYALVKQGRKVGHVFLEEDLKKTQQSYIALDNNVHLPKFRENPSIITREAVEKSYHDLINTNRTMWMKHFGSLSPASLMSKFEWMAIKGMEFIILDHISMVFSGSDNGNERKEIDMLLTELAAFTTKTGVHPIIVSHVKRTNKTPKRDKEGNVTYPYWDEVDTAQARGSGAFEQLGWNLIGIEPEILEDKKRGRIRTRVLKNREWGQLGIADMLTMSKQTGRLVLATEEMF